MKFRFELGAKIRFVRGVGNSRLRLYRLSVVEEKKTYHEFLIASSISGGDFMPRLSHSCLYSSSSFSIFMRFFNNLTQYLTIKRLMNFR